MEIKKYYTLSQKKTIVEVKHKPPGGAASILQKIKTILENEPLSQNERAELQEKAAYIACAYTKKNGTSSWFQGTTKKVNALAVSIDDLANPLATVPLLPDDVFSKMAQHLPNSTFGALVQVSKGIAAKTEDSLCDRAKDLGSDGEGGVTEAQQFCAALMNSLDYFMLSPKNCMSGELSEEDQKNILLHIERAGIYCFHSKG